MTDRAETVDVLARHPVPRHRLTVAAYHRLGEAGVLGEDDRVELLQGQLVDMSPIGPRHALAVDTLNRLLGRAVADQGLVRVQNPITLDSGSEPQPDLTVVRHPWPGFPNAHPGPDDVLLLVEVADTSLEVDRGAKRELYARAGIREFWIVDLTTNSVLVHRDPDQDEYKSVTPLRGSAYLEPRDLTGVRLPVASIFV